MVWCPCVIALKRWKLKEVKVTCPKFIHRAKSKKWYLNSGPKIQDNRSQDLEII